MLKFSLIYFTYSKIFKSLTKFSIADVLFATLVLFDSRFGIVDDQKRAAYFAHFHLLLIGVVVNGQLELLEIEIVAI